MNHERVGVRVNDISTSFFEEDIKAIVCLLLSLPPSPPTLALTHRSFVELVYIVVSPKRNEPHPPENPSGTRFGLRLEMYI